MQVRRYIPEGRIGISWVQQYQDVTIVDVPPLSADHLRAAQCFYFNPDYGPTRSSIAITRIQRIQDVRRIREYEERKDRLRAEVGERHINERFLFRDVNRFPNLEELVATGSEVRSVPKLTRMCLEGITAYHHGIGANPDPAGVCRETATWRLVQQRLVLLRIQSDEPGEV